MLRIVRSNRTERLLDHLLEEIGRDRDPMAVEVLVVQDMGMARWLSHRIAGATGVAANLEFVVPAKLVQRVFRAWFGKEVTPDGWSKDFLLWAVLREMPGLMDLPECRRLKEYLKEQNDWPRKYQLAKRIADVFYRYLIYRPDTIMAWESDRDFERGCEKYKEIDDLRWQKLLWKRIADHVKTPHQAQLYARFCECIKKGIGPVEPGELPERVFAFGVTALAPAHVDVLGGLSRFRDVTVYHLNPCREYWGDVPGKDSGVAWELLSEISGVENFYRDQPNPIMASWAQAGRFLLDRLTEIQGAEEIDYFEEPTGDTVLKALQRDVFNLTLEALENPPDREDQSVQVHVCHSPMREIQILHDRIADLLEKHPDWQPEDFVVMAPDINVYAPYIEAVFGSRKDPAIPWNLSERRPIMEDPLLETLVDLLGLPRLRCTATEILSLLEKKPIARCFGLDGVPFDFLRRWVRESGIRWGIDGNMKAEMGLPVEHGNTWRMGLERLLAGYALPPEELFFRDILSYPHVEGMDAAVLGGLCEIVDRIAFWRKRFSQSFKPREWQDLLNQFLDDFCAPDVEDEASLDRFRRAVDAFVSGAEEAHFDEAVPVTLVECALRDFLSDTHGMKRFLSGGVTFCNLAPMRAIPFKVVWILGMNDEEFPRSDRSPAFDLIPACPRSGDRFRAWEDRFLFLEAFISAREVFAVSYVGRDIRDNSRKVPSVLVAELLEAIEKKWPHKCDMRPSDMFVVEHPLQPFSRRIYDGSDGRLFSYDSLWCVDFGRKQAAEPEPFCDTEIALCDDSKPNVVSLDTLVRFFENPARYFLENSLNVALPLEEDAPEDSEPFVVSALDKYYILEEAVWEILGRSVSGEELERRFAAKGILPHGKARRIWWDGIFKEAEAMARKIVELIGKDRPVKRHVSVEIDDIMLEGIIPEIPEKGCLLFRPGKIRGKDRIRLWIYHLALCCLHPDNRNISGVFVGKDEKMEVKYVEQPEAHLKRLIDLWLRGRKRPLRFFPDSSWKYAVTALSEKGGDRAIKAIEKICGNEWREDFNQRGEYYDPFVKIAFRGCEALDNEFCDIAIRVFEPLIKHMVDGK